MYSSSLCACLLAYIPNETVRMINHDKKKCCQLDKIKANSYCNQMYKETPLRKTTENKHFILVFPWPIILIYQIDVSVRVAVSPALYVMKKTKKDIFF